MPTTNRDTVIEVFIGMHSDAWRFYAHGWVPPYIRQKLDRHGEAFPVCQPDLTGLENFMFQLDAPYKKKVTKSGGVEIEARGRSAIVFGEWLDALLGVV